MPELVYQAIEVINTGDVELNAMAFIKLILSRLDETERRRVLAWVVAMKEETA